MYIPLTDDIFTLTIPVPTVIIYIMAILGVLMIVKAIISFVRSK